MTDRVYTNLTITSGNLITKNIQCSAGLTCGNINASDVTIGNLTVTGFTTTVNVTEQNVVDTNITTGTLNATGITAGNINFTGNLYQNGVAYQGSQWTTTSGNVSYTSGSIIGTSVSASNMISTSQTTGTLVASSGITSGNINFTGNLYKNGALYSPSASPVYGIYPASGIPSTNNDTNISSYFGTTTAMSGLVKSSTGWTNSSGSTMVLQISYNFPVVTSNNNNFMRIAIRINGAGDYIPFQIYIPSNGQTALNSGIIILNNGKYFEVDSTRTTFNSGTGTLYVNVLH